MAHKWTVKRGEKEHGPLSSDQLRNLARTGKLKPTDLVLRGETGEWKEASSVAGLLSQSDAVATTTTTVSAPEHEATPPQSDSLGFIDWYKTKWMFQQPSVAQAALWLFYGWLWIPVWYMTTARTGNIFVKVAVGAILLALFLPAIKNAREAARRAQERANANSQSPTLDADERLALLRSENMTAVPADAVVLHDQAIDESFSPYKSGLERLEDKFVLMGGPLIRIVSEVKHSPGNIIESGMMKSYTFESKSGPALDEKDFGGTTTTRTRVRVHDGTIQTADDANGDSILENDSFWEPVLKLGAKTGDRWNREVRDVHDATYTVKNFFEWNGGVYAVVEEKSIHKTTNGNKLRFRTTTWYQQHVGKVRWTTWYAEGDAPLAWKHSGITVPVDRKSVPSPNAKESEGTQSIRYELRPKLAYIALTGNERISLTGLVGRTRFQQTTPETFQNWMRDAARTVDPSMSHAEIEALATPTDIEDRRISGFAVEVHFVRYGPNVQLAFIPKTDGGELCLLMAQIDGKKYSPIEDR